MLAFAGVVTACGDDDDGGVDDAEFNELVDGLADALQIDRGDAECFADELVDTLGEDTLRGLQDTDREPTADESLAIVDAFAECDIPLN